MQDFSAFCNYKQYYYECSLCLLWVNNQGRGLPGHTVCLHLASQDNSTFCCRMFSQKVTITDKV